ncbi:hypothetical protein P261_00889 [Lachnospiraceae bacterium TWA4]|nr:hypothetical protein P261_00889 [Lachnospiraceae bacterium TWA4]
MQELVDSEYIIASRFHAMVLGIIANKPVFPLVYSDKTIHVLDDINYCGKYVDIRDGKLLTYEMSRWNLDHNVVMEVEQIQKKAEEHFKNLDRILE